MGGGCFGGQHRPCDGKINAIARIKCQTPRGPPGGDELHHHSGIGPPGRVQADGEKQAEQAGLRPNQQTREGGQTAPTRSGRSRHARLRKEGHKIVGSFTCGPVVRIPGEGAWAKDQLGLQPQCRPKLIRDAEAKFNIRNHPLSGGRLQELRGWWNAIGTVGRVLSPWPAR